MNNDNLEGKIEVKGEINPLKLYYLSHPYTTYGDKEKNRVMAKLIESNLHKTLQCGRLINPVALELGSDGRDAMVQCINLLSACDGIIMCPDWEKSKGCHEEFVYAVASGLDVIYLEQI